MKATALLIGGLAAATIAFAAPAAADTDDISWGNEQLGGSFGTTGGSLSLGGTTTTVFGGTTDLVGGIRVERGDDFSQVTQSYGAFGIGTGEGLETEWESSINGVPRSVEGYVYYTPPKFATFEASGPGFATEWVCDPICHAVE